MQIGEGGQKGEGAKQALIDRYSLSPVFFHSQSEHSDLSFYTGCSVCVSTDLSWILSYLSLHVHAMAAGYLNSEQWDVYTCIIFLLKKIIE